MPRKPRTQKRDAPADTVPTLKALASALGVSQNTITQWAKDGLVGGVKGAWSIVSTYLAALRAGMSPKIPRDRRLQDLIDDARIAIQGEPGELDDQSDVGPIKPGDLPGTSAYDRIALRGRWSYAKALEREKVIGEEIANERRRQELDTAKGNLVPVAEATKAAALVRDRFVALGERLGPAIIAHLVDQPPAVQQAVLVATEKAWAEGLAEVDG